MLEKFIQPDHSIMNF